MNVELVVSLLALVIALAAFCAAAWFFLRSTVDPDVEELASQVVSLRKSHRAEQMRRVRETPPQVAAAPAIDHPPGFVPNPMATMSKADLRKIAMSTDPLRSN